MSKELDFTKAKKKFLTITFIDGNKILLRTPTKKIMDRMVNLGKEFEVVEGEDPDNSDAINEIYSACADIMSNNLAQKKIEVDYLSEVIDLEDLTLFFEAYTEFVNELNAVKN
ncbi:MAG: hypothetical protein PHC95_14595 [Parabacteroides sp.]|nr:hypothetical protein [Parabacteroides sp.]